MDLTVSESETKYNVTKHIPELPEAAVELDILERHFTEIILQLIGGVCLCCQAVAVITLYVNHVSSV